MQGSRIVEMLNIDIFPLRNSSQIHLFIPSDEFMVIRFKLFRHLLRKCNPLIRQQIAKYVH